VSEEFCRSDEVRQNHQQQQQQQQKKKNEKKETVYPSRVVLSPSRGGSGSFRWQMYNASHSGCLRTLRCMLSQ